jgi:hypothetical protein
VRRNESQVRQRWVAGRTHAVSKCSLALTSSWTRISVKLGLEALKLINWSLKTQQRLEAFM